MGPFAGRGNTALRYVPAGTRTRRAVLPLAWRRLASAASASPAFTGRLAHRVVGRNHEQVRRRLVAVDVGQLVLDDAGARIGVARVHQHPQRGRLPPLAGDLDGPVVADLPDRNDGRRLPTVCLDALELAAAQRFLC